MAAPFPSRAEIGAGQLARLRSLLAALRPANPFYTEKLAASKITDEIESLAAFAEKIPFTTKAELVADQAAHPPYGRNLTYPLARYTRLHATSGTTGQPLRWLDTPESWQWMVDNWAEVLRAAGVVPGDRVFFAFSFGPFIGFWLAFEAAQKLGCLCLPAGGTSSEARLKMILDNAVTVLCGTPTYLLHLAEVAARTGVDLHRTSVKTLLVAGEPGGSIPATRARLEQAWPGAQVRDHHGMTEVGPVTYECPAQPGTLHVLEPEFFAEIVHPETGRTVTPGETGELILTPLGRTGSPLLRYRTGDLVQAAPTEVCACGSSQLALKGGILGRADDMVIVRGVNIYPNAVEEIIRRLPEIVEYRATVTHAGSLAELRLEIETASPDTAAAAVARLEKALQLAFNLRVPVQAVPPGSLPRFEMKARRWQRTQ